MIKKFLKRMRPPEDRGLFHNSREDVRTIATYCNELADKVNELVDEVNKLKAQDKG